MRTLALIHCLALLATAFLTSASAADLKPLMAVPGKIALESDFSKPAPLDKSQFLRRQGTRWAIEDGVLRGRPSTPEYQASKPDHKGYEARTSIPVTPPEFVAKFSIRFLDGEETTIVPFVEFGHHVARLKFSAEGTNLIADGETVILASAPDFKYEPGQWYHALAELKGDEFVIQFAEGPTLYAKHECFGAPNPSGGNGFGTAGPKNGIVEIDDLTLWSIKPEAQPGWKEIRASFPEFTPVPTGKVKKVKASRK